MTRHPPDTLPEDGILVAWSLEHEHGRQPLGFRIEARATDRPTLDPILFTGEGHLMTIASTGAGTRSAAGRLVLNVLASVSQWEREAIGERTRDTMQSMKSAGRVIARATYGYDATPDGRLIRNETEQAHIATMRTMRADGMSYGRIADRMSGDGIATKRGASNWSAATVRNIIQGAA
jgi:hypothetical protein